MKHLSRNSVVFLLGFVLSAYSHPIEAQTDLKEEAFRWIDGNQQTITGLSDAIWELAELPMEEYQSARLLADALEKNGFHVERGVAGMPTAFIATYGSGKPELGFLAEYDALPGLSQKAVPHREPLVEGGNGHGCGHNLLGAGSSAAAMAVKCLMERHNLEGTIKLFGCPNEENDIGKVFMAKEGLFDSLSAAVDWHPGSVTAVSLEGSHAIHNFTVTFRGQAAHAGGSPWSGRSALDGIEVMNMAVNLLREHVLPTVRIHYAITEGGNVPNVVPDRAVAWYNMFVAAKTLAATVLDLMTQPALLGQVRQEWEQKTEGKPYKFSPSSRCGSSRRTGTQEIAASCPRH